jgi:ubiquinone/menaquinone biosynthesis C-methylase UbiE
MGRLICPPWVGYLLLNPLRKLLENPDKILGRFVRQRMIVLETGCGMGYFTLPLARMVGPKGRVVAVDIEPKMLSVLERRAKKAGLLDRIEIRQVEGEGLGLEELTGEVDFSVALHMVHEVPDQASFFTDVWQALKPDGKLLVIEPKGHVSQDQFEQTIGFAKKIGFRAEAPPGKAGSRNALLIKPRI